MKCPSPVTVKEPNRKYSKWLEVPCGKCGACQQNRRSEWTFRLLQEEKVSTSCHFVTLTYSDKKLPYVEETGEVSLKKKHLQDFLKRLRKAQWEFDTLSPKIRYYAVGEYGSKTDRPHYHIILFNCIKPVLTKIETLWGHGWAHAGSGQIASMHYVAKYHVNRTYEKTTREPEFATMSRRPGIGANYLDTTTRWHKENLNNFVVNNGFKQKLPRYYKDKIFTESEKEQLRQKSEQKTSSDHHHEVERLEKLHIKDPEKYIKDSHTREAQKVKNKSGKNDSF